MRITELNLLTKRGEYISMFCIGAVCYGLLEIIWRGHTHWTMVLTGGVCVMILHWSNMRNYYKSLWVKCAYGSMYITMVEFAVGWLVNIQMDMNVWDYSDQFMNIMGQVCLLYSIFWYLLTIPTVFLSNYFISRRPRGIVWKKEGGRQK